MKNIVLLAAFAVTIAACVPSQQAMHQSGGGGGGNPAAAASVDGWGDRPDLVDRSGNVSMNPGETKTDHPSTDPGDFGFSGDGPPSIDG